MNAQGAMTPEGSGTKQELWKLLPFGGLPIDVFRTKEEGQNRNLARGPRERGISEFLGENPGNFPAFYGRFAETRLKCSKLAIPHLETCSDFRDLGFRHPSATELGIHGLCPSSW